MGIVFACRARVASDSGERARLGRGRRRLADANFKCCEAGNRGRLFWRAAKTSGRAARAPQNARDLATVGESWISDCQSEVEEFVFDPIGRSVNQDISQNPIVSLANDVRPSTDTLRGAKSRPRVDRWLEDAIHPLTMSGHDLRAERKINATTHEAKRHSARRGRKGADGTIL